MERKAETKARLDVLVAGAGYVGLAAAVSLKQARPGLAVALVDAAPAGAWQRDGRASAIAAAACRMLDQLGVWAEIVPQAQAITEMIITNFRSADRCARFSRPSAAKWRRASRSRIWSPTER